MTDDEKRADVRHMLRVLVEQLEEGKFTPTDCVVMMAERPADSGELMQHLFARPRSPFEWGTVLMWMAFSMMGFVRREQFVPLPNHPEIEHIQTPRIH